ncbi:thioesterase family protein [Streptomyces sp. NPDC044984]|uniref:acyl-CoA thioesterase n=1 Tax=Streptomyces sp. NPDC044984 TaxID=3154335 RepID=UPI00340A47C2
MTDRHLFLCPMRWADVDANRHVNNVQYSRYLEEARVHLYRELTAFAERQGIAPSGNAYIVTRQEILFLRPLTYHPEPVTIETRVTKLRGATVDLSAEILDGDHLCAKASTTMACVTRGDGRPARLGAAERAFFAQFGSC